MSISIHCCIMRDINGQEHYLFNANAKTLEELLAGSMKGVFPQETGLYRAKQYSFRYDLIVNVWHFQPLSARELYTTYTDTLILLVATAGIATAPVVSDIRRFLLSPL